MPDPTLNRTAPRRRRAVCSRLASLIRYDRKESQCQRPL